MSPTAAKVTEAPTDDFRGSAAGLGPVTAAGLGPVTAVARALAGLAEVVEVVESAADVTTVLPGEPPKEQAEAASATARLVMARRPPRRMRPNLARDGPACGDVERDGGSGRARRGPHGPEILAHCQRIGTQFGLYSDVLFHTEVTVLSWDEAGARWVIETSRGDRLTAQFVVLGTGPLSVPKLPGIPGIGSFRGHSFHTSRWDYNYTGGDYRGAPMDKLADKRVGLLGTGATAVQCVPHLTLTPPSPPPPHTQARRHAPGSTSCSGAVGGGLGGPGCWFTEKIGGLGCPILGSGYRGTGCAQAPGRVQIRAGQIRDGPIRDGE
jgi:hypothetical protein